MPCIHTFFQALCCSNNNHNQQFHDLDEHLWLIQMSQKSKTMVGSHMIRHPPTRKSARKLSTAPYAKRSKNTSCTSAMVDANATPHGTSCNEKSEQQRRKPSPPMEPIVRPPPLVDDQKKAALDMECKGQCASLCVAPLLCLDTLDNMLLYRLSDGFDGVRPVQPDTVVLRHCIRCHVDRFTNEEAKMSWDMMKKQCVASMIRFTQELRHPWLCTGCKNQLQHVMAHQKQLAETFEKQCFTHIQDKLRALDQSAYLSVMKEHVHDTASASTLADITTTTASRMKRTKKKQNVASATPTITTPNTSRTTALLQRLPTRCAIVLDAGDLLLQFAQEMVLDV